MTVFGLQFICVRLTLMMTSMCPGLAGWIPYSCTSYIFFTGHSRLQWVSSTQHTSCSAGMQLPQQPCLTFLTVPLCIWVRQH